MKMIISTILIMLATGLSVFLGTEVFNSLVLTFTFYYLGFGILLPVLDLLVIRKKGFKDLLTYLGWKVSRKNTLIGVLFGLFFFLIIHLAVFLFKDIFFSDNTVLAAVENWGMGRKQLILVFLVMLLFNGALEEIYWRGYIHRRLEPVSSRPLALALPIFFFTAQHLVIIVNLLANPLGVFLFMLGIGIGGVIWQIMREYTKSTYACALSHIGATAGYMTVFYLYIVR